MALQSTLLDLVTAVSKYSASDAEVVATVARPPAPSSCVGTSGSEEAVSPESPAWRFAMTTREQRPVRVAAIPIDGFASDLAEGQAARYAYERDAAMAAALSAVWAGYEPNN